MEAESAGSGCFKSVGARLDRDELENLFLGYGYKPYFVEGDDPEKMHQLMASTLDDVFAEVQAIQKNARTAGFRNRHFCFSMHQAQHSAISRNNNGAKRLNLPKLLPCVDPTD